MFCVKNKHISFCFMQMIQAGSPDILTYTTVCSDYIPSLAPFKSNCMPVFLLVSAGNIVAFVHGADGKKMKEVRDIEIQQLLCNM